MTKIENITTPKASISSQHCRSFRFHCQTIQLYIGFYHQDVISKHNIKGFVEDSRFLEENIAAVAVEAKCTRSI